MNQQSPEQGNHQYATRRTSARSLEDIDIEDIKEREEETKTSIPTLGQNFIDI